jgi:hypothetical protein
MFILCTGHLQFAPSNKEKMKSIFAKRKRKKESQKEIEKEK